MSELTNFLKKKYKTPASFDKNFGGDGQAAMKLLETIGEASPAVNKEAQKFFREHPDDIAKGVAAIRRAVYGESGPKGGVRGKTASKPEVIEGNLPTNDTAVVADPPKSKSKGTGKAAAAGGGSKRAAKTEEVAVEGSEDELDASIGQFVPFTQDIVGQGPDFSLSTDTNDLLRGAQSMQTPTGEIDRLLQSPPAPQPRQFAPQSMADMADQAEAMPAAAMPLDYPTQSSLDLFALLGDTADPAADFGPYRDGLFDFSAARPAMTPPVDPSLPGTTAPDGGFLGVDQGASPINAEGGFAAGDYGPSMFNDAGGFMDGDYGPTQINPDGGFMDGDYGPSQTNPLGGFMAGDYGPPPPPPKQPRPPLYDPNQKLGDWWSQPGPVSRANEFLYQRGMPATLARAAQPTASAIDKTLKVGSAFGLPLGAAVGVGALGLKGAQAVSNYMNSDSPSAPPTDAQMDELSRRITESEAKVRQMMQPPRTNPASAPPSTPVK